MQNEYYFSIRVTQEQIDLAKELVEYSLIHHPISNIWDDNNKSKTSKLRFTGTLGEIIFSDLYKLKRPTRSFGAIDGQDYGKDFEINIGNQTMNFDIKTMHRESNRFYKNYVLNIPARNVNRKDSLTDYYYCLSLHEESNYSTASVLGYVKKDSIRNGKVGILYSKGSKRVRSNGTSFTFFEDTYEIIFEDIITPLISKRIETLNSFIKYRLK
jgi:hypothetical protein